MTDSIISVRINKEILERMRMCNEINWSSLIRNSINKRLENMEEINQKKARESAKKMDEIRKSHIDKGKTGVEIIREWRERRK